jgi:hypothetical protein
LLSYWFVLSLAACDLVMTLISIVHLVPAVAFHHMPLHSTRNIIMLVSV